jgi:hypothetical protein
VANAVHREEQCEMAVAVILEYENVSPDQYDAVIADMGMTGQRQPHQILHVAGSMPNGGWRVVDIWESREAFEAFVCSQVVPTAAKYEITEDPKIDIWPVHQLLAGAVNKARGGAIDGRAA